MSKNIRFTSLILFVLSFVVIFTTGGLARLMPNASQQSNKRHAPYAPIRVMTVGSSVAEGWVDTEGGYLARGFATLSAQTDHAYTVIRKAKAGDTSTKITAQYSGWLKTVHPQVVVLSWGGLDDANAKTPMPQYDKAIHDQIALALSHHAVVIVVTPPVTRASYTQYRVQEAAYLNREMEIARSFHSSNVVVCNVFDQMKAYLVAHHQTYVPYMADGWHPNSRGHILGGQLLSQDLLAHYGQRAISFHG